MRRLALALLVVVFLAGSAPRSGRGDASAPPPDAGYEVLKAEAGTDATGQVALALWCEEHGLIAERRLHLERAVTIDPRDALARGLLGLLEYQGQWVTPGAAVAEASKNNQRLAAVLAEYNARLDTALRQNDALQGLRWVHGARQKMAMERFKLGLWCEKAGLPAEATAEFTAAVNIDAHCEDAWKRLGCVRHDGHWMLLQQAAAARAEAQAQLEANGRWEPLFRKWKVWLKDKKLQPQAEDELVKVTDPRAVVAIGRVFCDSREDDQAWAARLLGQIDGPRATRALGTLAVYSAFDDVRQRAAERLAPRPWRDYARELVEMIHTPPVYDIKPVRGPGSEGVLVIDTPRYQVIRAYDAPAAFRLGFGFGGYVGHDANGLPIALRAVELEQLMIASQAGMSLELPLAQVRERTAAMIAAANLKAVAAQRQLAADVKVLEQTRLTTSQINASAGRILQENAGAPDLKDDEVAWHQWYYDKIGYSYTPPPKVTVTQTLPYLPPPSLVSCFAAGTLVWTQHGTRPIEQIRAGDQVLSQSTTSGALGYQPVRVVHHNPPGKTIRLVLDTGETLIPSIYHRFWIAGKGWAMARDLKPGDALRILGGRAVVTQAEPDAVVPVFNLTISNDHTYFVGVYGCLVHDNAVPDPVDTPFDARPRLAAAR